MPWSPEGTPHQRCGQAHREWGKYRSLGPCLGVRTEPCASSIAASPWVRACRRRRGVVGRRACWKATVATQRRGRARRGCVPAIHSRCCVPAHVPAVAGTASGSPATLRGDEITTAGMDRRSMRSEGAAAAGDEDAPYRDGASCDAARKGTPAAVQTHTLKAGLRIEHGSLRTECRALPFAQKRRREAQSAAVFFG